MSLFFEDEIKRAREKADSLGLNDFMFQDPRSNKKTSQNKHRTSRRTSRVRVTSRNHRQKNNIWDNFWNFGRASRVRNTSDNRKRTSRVRNTSENRKRTSRVRNTMENRKRTSRVRNTMENRKRTSRVRNTMENRNKRTSRVRNTIG